MVLIKKYLPQAASAGEPAHWTEFWSQQSLAQNVGLCEISFLKPLFDKFFPPSGVVLEGGCGLGYWVVHYARKGYQIIGVDFAHDTLRQLKDFYAPAAVCGARVEALPLRDGSVDAYWSGGVVEHLEEGPEDALAEAHRVLKPGGMLLISVPELNTLRRLRFRRGAGVFYDEKGARAFAYRRVQGHCQDRPPAEGLRFSEYIYDDAVFTRLLKDAGFQVLYTKSCLVEHGLMELAWFRLLVAALRRARRRLLPCHSNGSAASVNAPSNRASGVATSLIRYSEAGMRVLKRLLVYEDESLWPLRPGLRFLQRHAGYMKIYACQKVGRGGGPEGSSRP